MASTKIKELAELYGNKWDVNVITERVKQFEMLSCVKNESMAIKYLQKADMDVNRAIDFFYSGVRVTPDPGEDPFPVGGTLSPSPSPRKGPSPNLPSASPTPGAHIDLDLTTGPNNSAATSEAGSMPPPPKRKKRKQRGRKPKKEEESDSGISLPSTAVSSLAPSRPGSRSESISAATGRVRRSGRRSAALKRKAKSESNTRSVSPGCPSKPPAAKRRKAMDQQSPLGPVNTNIEDGEDEKEPLPMDQDSASDFEAPSSGGESDDDFAPPGKRAKKKKPASRKKLAKLDDLDELLGESDEENINPAHKPTTEFDDDEPQDEVKCDTNWTRKMLGRIEVEFEQKAVVGEVGRFFRTMKCLGDSLNNKEVKATDDKSQKLVKEIVTAVEKKHMTCWIHCNPRQKPAKVDGNKDMERVKVTFMPYIHKAAHGKEANLESVVDKFSNLVIGNKNSMDTDEKEEKKEDEKEEEKGDDGVGAQLIRDFQKDLPEYNGKVEKLKLNMDGLLDFACRWTWTEEEQREIRAMPDKQHGLSDPKTPNFMLRDYQLQSINWMLKQERRRDGLYRHFFQRGKFKDGQAYWWSPYFKMMDFEGPPRIHGGILCEEMGLGKTVEMLALCNSNPCIVKRKPYTRTVAYNNIGNVQMIPTAGVLIVSPVSLVGQWKTEIMRWNRGKPKCCFYYGMSGQKGQSRTHLQDPKVLAKYDFVLTTYNTMISKKEKNKNYPLLRVDWHRIVLDESHTIKASNNQTTKNCLALAGRNKWCLTGTPFNTTITDLMNQLKFVGFKNPLDTKKFWDESNKNFIGGNFEEVVPLLQVLKTTVMRHKKAQNFNNRHIVNMPKKHENNMAVEFSAVQRALYDRMYKAAHIEFKALKAAGLLSSSHFKVMQLMRRLRHPCSGGEFDVGVINAQLKDAEEGKNMPQAKGGGAVATGLSGNSKMQYAASEAYNAEDEECSICLEIMEDPLQTKCGHLFCDSCIKGVLEDSPKCPICRKPCQEKDLRKPKKKKPEIPGGGSSEGGCGKKCGGKLDTQGVLKNLRKVAFNTKVDVLVLELDRLKVEKPGEKALVFTQFTDTMKWLEAELKRRGYSTRTIKGSMTMYQRSKALDAFINDPPTTVFLLTVRSGGVGLTLTAAQHVYMMEPCLNLALHRQAINRVYRLGQTKEVHIWTLFMKGSIEEQIIAHNKNKTERDFGSGGNIVRDKASVKENELEVLFKDFTVSS